MATGKYHIPVLLEESIAGLALLEKGTYLDLTFGGGGHSQRILDGLKKGRLVAFDQDPEVKSHLISDDRFQFIGHNFRYMKNFLDYYRLGKVDGVLADLGVSSHQFDKGERGFSFRMDAPLDMRMSPGIKEGARELVNNADKAKLTRIFREYGELNRPAVWADKILSYRADKHIETTGELVDCIESLLPRGKENKELAKLFQAIRIEVNREMEGLKEMLSQCTSCIKPGGRLVVISYHSNEDRLVKNFINTGNTEGRLAKDFFGNVIRPFKAVNKKLILPSVEEIAKNPRARSARMRIAERISYE